MVVSFALVNEKVIKNNIHHNCQNIICKQQFFNV